MNDKLDIEITEDEDVARAKAWWKENGSSIIGGIAIGTALVIGYNFWNQYTETQAKQASALYEQAAATDNADAAKQATEQLVEEYDGSVYATMALLQTAKTAVENDELDAAATSLEKALSLTGTDAALASIVRLRLAAVHNAAANHDQALSVLGDASMVGNETLTARIEELKGDAFYGKDDLEAARAAYEASLESALGNQSRSLVQLKLDNL